MSENPGYSSACTPVGRPRSLARWSTGARLAVVVGFGFLLIRLAFVVTVPFGSGPDETDHFIKAFGAARFDFGNSDNIPTVANPNDMQLLNQSLSTLITMGSHAFNPTWTCNAGQPTIPATCVDPNAALIPGKVATTFGTFQPFIYIVIGVPSLVIDDPDTSMLGMRLVIAAWTTVFTTFGLVVAARRFGNRGLLASVLGWTPMVLYAQGTLGTSGIEAASAFAVFLSGLDVLSNGGRSTRGSRAILVASAVTLALSRPLSVMILAILVVLVVLTFGFRESWRRVVALPRPFAIAATAMTAIAVLLNLAWSFVSPPIYLGRDLGVMGTLGHYFLDTLPLLWRMVIGLFEWLDTELPMLAIIVAWAAIIAVLAWTSDQRDRAATGRLWFLIVATIGFGFVADYTVFARVGGTPQGRHLLPLFQLWPLVALLPTQLSVEANRRDGKRLNPLRLGVVVMAAVTGASWVYIARREAVGILGPLNFFGNAAWHPIAGWKLPVALLLSGLLLSSVAPVVAGMFTRDADLHNTHDEIHAAEQEAGMATT